MHTVFWLQNLKGRDHLEDIGADGRMYLREIGCESPDWTSLAWDKEEWRALVNTVMNIRVSLKVRNFLSSCVTIGFSRRTLLHRVSE
jgi:7,8-dihydro-6-hydroxymethylpterin-pyrophosphokinase